jgi:hypothetical protein
VTTLNQDIGNQATTDVKRSPNADIEEELDVMHNEPIDEQRNLDITSGRAKQTKTPSTADHGSFKPNQSFDVNPLVQGSILSKSNLIQEPRPN